MVCVERRGETAGACGALPGAVLGSADAMGCDEKEIAEAMLAAGMIGVFISKFSAFAAEVAGCQAECGAGSGMAAAALVGKAIAERAKAAGIERVAFDRAGFKYHGRVKSLEDEDSKNGLQF